VSKLEAEHAARLHEGSLPITIVRPAAVYGPRDGDFLRAFRLATRAIALHAIPRDHAFSIVHVADAVHALLLAAEHPAAVGRTYFVANERPISWRELYAEMAACRRCQSEAGAAASAAGHRARRTGGRRRECAHRMAFARQPPQDEAGAATLVALRRDPRPRRARLA
jgi:nucleoside-diphosphate-sugar epimerase